MPDRLLSALTPREHNILRLMALDLSNAEIAERLVVSPQTVKWYVKEIYSKLGVHSRDEAIALAETLEVPTESHAPSTLHHLPAPVTSLVGRTREITAVRTLLRDDDVRLVTLLGAPGIGKTRLSLEVAHRLTADFPDGVVFVPLAPLSDPALVGDAILSALGLDAEGSRSAAERLGLFLKAKHLLLVLDNFEHLLDAAQLVGELLAEAPDLKVLATSREPLRVYGEREYSVPPLEPTGEAVTLFVERARAVRPDFDVSEHNAVTLTAICKRLDGLPLAIELAAARMKLYTPHALLGRLASRLNVLTGGARDLSPRQQTLRAAIKWSYDLLTVDEQRMFARFAVFDGEASLEAFVEVCGGGLAPDPFEGLESLISKSLVQQASGADGEPRFTMYEALIEFAAGQLVASGEEEATRIAHARHYLTLAAAYADSFRTADEPWGFRGFEVEYPNLRAAWLFAATQPDDELIGIAAAHLPTLYLQLGRVRDGAYLYETALQPRSEDETLTAAHLMSGCSKLCWLLGDNSRHESLARRALGLFERHHDARGKASALHELACHASSRGDHQESEQLHREALEIARSQQWASFVDTQIMQLALVEHRRGNHKATILTLEMLLKSARQRAILSLESLLCFNLSIMYVAIGELDQASVHADDSLKAARSIHMSRKVGDACGAVAGIAYLRGDLSKAAEFAAQALRYDAYAGIVGRVTEDNALMAAVETRRGDLTSARRYWALVQDDLVHLTHDLDGMLIFPTLAHAPLVAHAVGKTELAVEIGAAVHAHLRADPWSQLNAELALTDLRAQLSPEAFDAAWARGAAYTLDELIAAAQRI